MLILHPPTSMCKTPGSLCSWNEAQKEMCFPREIGQSRDGQDGDLALTERGHLVRRYQTLLRAVWGLSAPRP